MTVAYEDLTSSEKEILNCLFKSGMRTAEELSELTGCDLEQVQEVLNDLVEIELVDEKPLDQHYVETIIDHTGGRHTVRNSRVITQYVTTVKAQKARK